MQVDLSELSPGLLTLRAWACSAEGHFFQGEILAASATTRTALILPEGELLARTVPFRHLLSVALAVGPYVIKAFGPPPPAPTVPEWATP